MFAEHLEDVEHPTVNDPNLKNEIGDETEDYGASYDEVVQHLITDGPDETALYRVNKKVQLHRHVHNGLVLHIKRT